MQPATPAIETVRARRVFGAVLVGVFVLVGLISLVETTLRPTLWSFLDWTISYEAGVVRRGLTGQVGLWLHGLTGLPLNAFVFLCHMGAYALFLGAAWRLTRGVRDYAPLALLLVSPALFAYPLADVIGSLRKEILFLALLAWLAAASVDRPGEAREAADRRRFRALAVALAVMPLLVLSHEMLAAWIPYLLWVAVEVRRTAGRILLLLGLLAVSAAAVGLAAAFARLEAAEVVLLCAAVEQAAWRMPTAPDCLSDGAILWLSLGPEAGMELMRARLMAMARSLPPLALLIGLGFLPVLAVLGTAAMRDRRLARALLRLAGLAVLSGVASLPLFVVAVDWGRFVYIHAASAAILLIALYVREERGLPPEATGLLAGRPIRLLGAVLLPAYALLWGIDHSEDLISPGVIAQLLKFAADFL